MRAAWPRHEPRRTLDRRRTPIDTDNEGERHAHSTGSLGSNCSSHFRVPAFERLCRAWFLQQSGLESLARVDLDSFGPSAPLSTKQETEITLPFPRSIVERRRFAAWRFRLFVVIGHRHFGAAPVRYADQFEWRGVFRPGRPDPAGHGAGSGRDHAHLDAAGQLRCHPRAGRERDPSSPRGAPVQRVRQQSAAVRSRTGYAHHTELPLSDRRHQRQPCRSRARSPGPQSTWISNAFLSFNVLSVAPVCQRHRGAQQYGIKKPHTPRGGRGDRLGSGTFGVPIPIPERHEYALMLCGLSLIGVVVREAAAFHPAPASLIASLRLTRRRGSARCRRSPAHRAR